LLNYPAPFLSIFYMACITVCIFSGSSIGLLNG